MGWWRSNRGKKDALISGTPAQALAAYVRPQPRVFNNRPGMTKLPTGPRVSRISGPIYEGVNKKVKGPRPVQKEKHRERLIGSNRWDNPGRIDAKNCPSRTPRRPDKDSQKISLPGTGSHLLDRQWIA